MSEHRFDVVVLGAGMGGLCAAARLAQAGYSTLLVEREERVGGRASSFHKDGYTINVGAVAIENGGEMERTFADLGIEMGIRYPEPANVFRVKGKTVNPGKGGWAFLLDRITKQGAKLLTQLGSAREGEMPEEQLTLADWIGKATGNETVHRLFRNLSAAIFAVNADEIPARAFLTYFMQKGAFRNFGFHPEGTVGVCEQIAGACTREGGEVWTGTSVERLNVENGAVSSIELSRDGETVTVGAGAVVSNLGPAATIELAGGEGFDADYLAEIERRNRPTANIIIHVAGDVPLIDSPGLMVLSATERLCNLGNMTATCPELAPEGKHLSVVYAVPVPAVGEFDEEGEVEKSLEELREEFPEEMERSEVIDVRVMRGEWPAQRAMSGWEMPRETPLDNLWHVGDGVRDYASGGTQACAETARDVAEELIGSLQPAS